MVLLFLLSEHFLSTVQVDLLLYEFNGSVFLRSYYLPYIVYSSNLKLVHKCIIHE